MLERIQINMEYNNTEDRLLLRISEKESNGMCSEYRAWFTRRFVSLFIKAIDKLIEDELAGDLQLSTDSLKAMKKFQQEAALEKADFTTSYEADAESCTPTGEEPILVTKLNLKKKSKNKYVLSFLTNENAGINITADIDLIHTIRKMLHASVKNAGWNQPVSQSAEEEVVASEAGSMRAS